jgi:pimeloyl-ACP methyl ester carboxylesterase
MKLFFDDANFDGQLQRSIGKCDSGMANVGECLYIASLITEGDRDSWYRQWSQFATGLVQQGDVAVSAGHPVSARGCYLRAAEYHRQSFFWHRDDLDATELTSGHAQSVAAFRKALPLLAHPATILDGETPGYLFTPAGDGPFPTVLHIGGYDGTAEELYASVDAAVDRGWAFAALDGPGTGIPLYLRREPMRPDWENVVPGMVDMVLAQPAVDPDRIVLVGRSFGGLLAPRGASGEPRLAAMVVDPGQYDMAESLRTRLGDLWDRVDDPTAEDQFQSLLEIPALATLFGPRMTTHGLTSVRGYLGEMRRYDCRDQAAAITCPSFVTDNETDLVSTGQGQELFDHLTAPKQFRRFVQSEGAEGHCEGMAPVVFWTAAFDWLESTITPERPSGVAAP